MMISGPVMLDVTSTSLTSEDREVIEHPLVGGVIFFTRNYESPDQLKELVQAIRKVKSHLILAVDQEGGRVQRFKNGFTELLPLGHFGERYELHPDEALEEAKNHAYLMASEIKSMGLDLSFAPVLDRNIGMNEVIGNRSFHADPEVITTLGSAYISGMKKASMPAVGKHFPGHGHVTADSHHKLPVDDQDLESIKLNDMLPFSKLIKALSGIMPAHIRYPEVDDRPAGFSKYWLQSVLRNELQFDGVIFSDCLSMAGAEFAGSFPDRAMMAFEAGCDIVLCCNNRNGAVEILENLRHYSNQESSRRLVEFLK